MNKDFKQGDSLVKKRLKIQTNCVENGRTENVDIIEYPNFPKYKKIKFSQKMDFQKYLGTKDVIVNIDEIDERTVVVKTRFSNTYIVEVPDFD